jgi:hypothetical protein
VNFTFSDNFFYEGNNPGDVAGLQMALTLDNVTGTACEISSALRVKRI